MMNPFSWLQMTNMISYQGLVRTFPKQCFIDGLRHLDSSVGRLGFRRLGTAINNGCLDQNLTLTDGINDA